MPDFIHLHNHSHYSILDGITKIPQLVAAAKNFNQKAVALTDHGNLFGTMEFQKECLNNEIKPIYGAELYIAPRSRFEKDKDNKYNHIIVLARDNEGYTNLVKLSSIGYLEGFYSKPRIDRDVLAEHSKGLIIMTACISGEIPRCILSDNNEALDESLTWFIDVFGKENFFLEIEHHNLKEELIVNKKMIEIAKETGLSLVAANDSHYVKPEDALLQEILFSIRDKTVLSDPDRYRLPNDSFYYKSPVEMEAVFSELPQALSITNQISEMCNVNLQPGMHTPLYKLQTGETPESELEKLCNKGLFDKFSGSPPQDYITRLKTEKEVIFKMGFANYFLIVSDYVRFARNTGILVGPGRGSAAGSLISWSLGITDIDPVKYGLLFERFLNPERVTMPDIDIDFQDDRRDEIKDYIRSKYGYSRTADIITFGVMKSRAVLKDVGRVMEIPLEKVNRITKLIDNKTANKDLSKVVEMIPELKEIQAKGSAIEKKWLDNSIKLDGTNRNIGTHASGLIISDTELADIVPLYRDNKSNLILTQFEGVYLEKNGLLKMDILGLSNLTMIKDCIERIRKNHGINLQIREIPLDDSEVFKLFWKGETSGIFQFESDGMTDYLKRLKPSCIDDLIAMNALYRPGPMDNIPSFMERKQGREEVDCFHKSLEPILKPTYGVIVYQEQVMQIAQVFAGFSPGKADEVRKIMSKKVLSELEKLKPQWVDGAVGRGYTKELAEKLFEILVPFSEYAFNKSHSAAYAILAYQIAYLKTHYRLEFMTSLLNMSMTESDKIRTYIKESLSYSIEISNPDINWSDWSFKDAMVKNGPGRIIFGFGAIKGLGESFSELIMDNRLLEGKYSSFEDFVRRTIKYTEFKKASVEILLKSGCFDCFFSDENFLKEKALKLYNLDNMIKTFQKENIDKKAGHRELFGNMDNHTEHLIEKIKPLSMKEEFENEVSVCGFYLSGKLFHHYTGRIGPVSCLASNVAGKLNVGTGILLWGFISDVSVKLSSNKKEYAIITLDNGADTFNLRLFSEKYDSFKQFLLKNEFIYMRLNISEGKNGPQIEIISIKPVEEIRHEKFTQINICIEGDDDNLEIISSLEKIKSLAVKPEYKGVLQIIFHIIGHNETSTILASNKYRIKNSMNLLNEISTIKGIKGYWLY